MGRFDGVLLCTDFDGTLAINSVISRENIEAIRYFKENGGRFTIVSGRHPAYLLEHQQEVGVNAPLVGYNGALIVDTETGEFLWKGGRKDYAVFEFVRRFWENDLHIRRLVVHNDEIRIPSCKRDAKPDTIDELIKSCSLPIYNMICTCAPENSESIRDELLVAAKETDFVISRSWEGGIEIINRGEEKGDAALRLKEMLSARLLVATGDFENDISMLRAADIGYAVGNATADVKSAADRVTVNCADHAIAAIIRELEERDL